MKLKQIGIIHSPFKQLDGMPIQPAGAEGVHGVVEVFDKYQPGLKDLDAFSHIILIYEFHQSHGYKLEVIPYMDTQPHGLFATRAPKRPNPIGLSTVKLNKIKNGKLYVQNLDILDGTPLLDIKPYVPAFESFDEIRTGWFKQAPKTVKNCKSDCRFK